MTSDDHKIYVRFIDGTEYFVPVEAHRHTDGTYQLMPNEAFDFDEDCTLFQFGAGDVVEVEQYRFSNSVDGLLAVRLVGKGSDRNICKRILFSILVESPDIQNLVGRFGMDGVSRFWIENKSKRQVYPGIAEWLHRNARAFEETIA